MRTICESLEWVWVYIIRTFRPIYCELSKAFSLEIFPVYKNVTIEVLYIYLEPMLLVELLAEERTELLRLEPGEGGGGRLAWGGEIPQSQRGL